MTALEEERDQTLVDLCDRLAARGIATSKSALSRFFQRRGITRQKKTGHAVEQDRPDVLSQRRAGSTPTRSRPRAAGLRRRDRTATNMARSHGRCRRGARLRMGFPHGHRKTTTLVAGLRLSGMIAPMVLDGPINGGAIAADSDPSLARALRGGEMRLTAYLSTPADGGASR